MPVCFHKTEPKQKPFKNAQTITSPEFLLRCGKSAIKIADKLRECLLIAGGIKIRCSGLIAKPMEHQHRKCPTQLTDRLIRVTVIVTPVIFIGESLKKQTEKLRTVISIQQLFGFLCQR